MPYKNIEQQRACQRASAARNRAEWLAGKSCARCGSMEQLEVDHIHPAEKVTHRVWSWSRARRLAELTKCQVLCKSCHQAKTKEDMGYADHGTRQYSLGCRCTICRAAHTESARAWRLRRRTG